MRLRARSPRISIFIDSIKSDHWTYCPHLFNQSGNHLHYKILEISIRLLKRNSQPREKINKRVKHLTEFQQRDASPVLLFSKMTNANRQNSMFKKRLPTTFRVDICLLALYLDLGSRFLKDRSSKGQHRISSQWSDLTHTG